MIVRHHPPGNARPLRTLACTFCLCVLCVSVISAADPEPSKPFSKVALDLDAGAIEQTLPFDIPFYFSGTAGANVRRFEIRMTKGAGNGVACTSAEEIMKKTTWVHREGAALTFLVFEP